MPKLRRPVAVSVPSNDCKRATKITTAPEFIDEPLNVLIVWLDSEDAGEMVPDKIFDDVFESLPDAFRLPPYCFAIKFESVPKLVVVDWNVRACVAAADNVPVGIVALDQSF